MSGPAGTDEPGDTRRAIMDATYRALREHGYTELTIQAIADEFEKSKSLLYYHYGSKDELVLDFLQHMYDRLEANVHAEVDAAAADRLDALLDRMLPESIGEDRLAFVTALTELRARAPHDPAFREQFTKADDLLHARIAGIIADGIDEGVFRPVDPDDTAELLLAAMNGMVLSRVTTDRPAAKRATRRALDAYVDAYLRRTARE